MKIEAPEDLVAALIEMFPGFRDKWDKSKGYGGVAQYNFHTVFMELAPFCCGYLAEASPRTVEAFSTLINDFVAAGGTRENAVSTCLLEHASQVRIRRVLTPHLSLAAKAELR